MEDVQETRLARLLEANALYEQGAYARAAETARALLAVLPGDAEMRRAQRSPASDRRIRCTRGQRARRSASTAQRGR